MGKYKSYPPDLLRYAQKGDKLIEEFAAELIPKKLKRKKYNPLQHRFYNNMYTAIKSNYCLYYSEPNFKLKIKVPRFSGAKSIAIRRKFKGDLVEARIAWLDENYGRESAFRFYKKCLFNYAKYLEKC